MKKKELISKIDSLITSLNEMNAELKACRQENASLKLQIEELSKAALERVEEKEEVTIEQPLEEVEESKDLEAEEIEVLSEEDEEKTEEPLEDVIETKVELKEIKEETIETTVEDTSAKKPLKILPMGEEVVLPDSIMEFGAEIIGKIVIESAKYADLVTASTTLNKKELLNLIMGKSEVCKAEILNIVTSGATTDAKISLINAELSEATDYFKSVVAQI